MLADFSDDRISWGGGGGCAGGRLLSRQVMRVSE